jgi:hypothetical protein
MATELGARPESSLTDMTTHLVATDFTSEKYKVRPSIAGSMSRGQVETDQPAFFDRAGLALAGLAYLIGQLDSGDALCLAGRWGRLAQGGELNPPMNQLTTRSALTRAA